MKHNTHIYLAAKAIEFLYEGMGNLRYAKSGKTVPSKLLREKRASAKTLQRMLMHYQQVISEASWAPDDILNDKSQFHTFKLYTDKEFPGGAVYAKEVHKENMDIPIEGTMLIWELIGIDEIKNQAIGEQKHAA